ncbi:MAG TPA: hypothetical protein VFK13_05800 [Gemmatimonadaceae bacterium]|nr:hypothetical protein [Gemmatimonadaceae bacterium]
MSEPRSHAQLPEEIVRLLREPVEEGPHARAQVMERVRAAAHDQHGSARRWRALWRPGWAWPWGSSLRSRRGLATPAALLAAAALGFVLLTSSRVPSFLHDITRGDAWEGVIDTVALLPVAVPAAPTREGFSAMRVLVEPLAAGIRDTLRLVRLVIDAPGVARVSLAAERGGYAVALPPVDSGRDALGRWSALVRVPPTLDHLTLLVNDSERVSIPAAALGASTAFPPSEP